jgi:hypothetical protein
MTVTRRTILKFGLGGAAMLALGGTGLALQATVQRDPRVPLVALSPRQFSVLAAVADRMCPKTDTLPSAWDVEVPEKIDALLARKAVADAEEFGLVLDLLENALAGLVLDGRFSTFTASPPETQDAVLRGMARSTLATRRTMYAALRGLCTASYWSDPRASRHIGYRRPEFGNVGVPHPLLPTPPRQEDTQAEVTP